MINFILGLFSFDLGIDLGTANTLIYVKGKGIAVREATVIARNKRNKEILAIGNQAAKMMGKTGKNIEVIRPLKGGVIADWEGAVALLTYFIRKIHNAGSPIKVPRPKIVIGIPSGVTQVEKRALVEVVTKAGARQVNLISEVVVAGLGVQKSKSHPTRAIIDIGGGTTDIGLLVDGKEAFGASVRVAGDEMDERIVEYVKLRYSLLIGTPSAEKIKIALVDAKPIKEIYYVARGRDLETGLPRSVRVGSIEIYETLVPSFNAILREVTQILEEAPPELVSDILRGGIILTGGGALIKNLDVFFSEKLKVAIHVAEDPLTAVVRGCGKLLSDNKLLKRLS